MKQYLENILINEKLGITFMGSNETLWIANPRVEGEFLKGLYKYSDLGPDGWIHSEEVIVVRIDAITSIRRSK